MIRLVRILAETDVVPVGLDELVGSGELDLLQLDYARPRLAPVTGAAPLELPELAVSFATALKGVCKTLFLEPGFRCATSAGLSTSYVCAEIAAQTLVAGGCADVPVAAVRGSNILPILDDLVADGLKLDNIETGAPWRTLREPVMAADLQLGAGPLATALAEGARVVVAGSYDGAAPTSAAAAHAFHWSWKELDRLAGAAAAARAALWPRRHHCDWLSASQRLPATHFHPRVELDPSGAFTVDLSHPCESADAGRLLEWLRAGGPNGPAHAHADVRYDASQAIVSRPGPTQLRVEGCTGVKTDDSWRLEVLYQAGFLAESMVEFFPGAAATLRRQVAEAFRAHFVDADDEHPLVTVQELAATEGDEAAASWLHLTCRSKAPEPCMEFADQIVRFATANPALARLPAGRPSVQAECGVWPARVPRDAVDIAIDTRPAKEW